MFHWAPFRVSLLPLSARTGVNDMDTASAAPPASPRRDHCRAGDGGRLRGLATWGQWVGRKTRRAHDAEFRLEAIAPVLSRTVRIAARRTAQNRRVFFVRESRTVGAPSFSPYRFIRPVAKALLNHAGNQGPYSFLIILVRLSQIGCQQSLLCCQFEG
jgi:hypothetical protein